MFIVQATDLIVSTSLLSKSQNDDSWIIVVIDESRVTVQIAASLIDDSGGIIYD